MSSNPNRRSIETWRGKELPRGQSSDVFLPVSESYSGISLRIPIRVIRGKEDGPVIFITAALHGDELNGTGAIRELICDETVQLNRGTLILVPILNLLAFDRHSRYLPDRRDLNRCFPGSAGGSLAGRIAKQIFSELVRRADLGIDLHTASVRRTNYPNIRADMENPEARKLALDFGCEVIVDGAGPKGSLRREACRIGCPTIVLEGGEVWKVEPAIVATAVRGIKNILRSHRMIDGEVLRPERQVVIEKTKWIRAERGGFLQFHVRPGQAVEKDQALATNTDLLGHQNSSLVAPFNGVVIGMTTLPAVSPGEPVCNIGELPDDTRPSEIRDSRSETQGLETRTVTDLASNVFVKKVDDDQ
ncbi:MAG: succinylglutamate desuccinylase/aspartoacylase family protein [Rubripirellula sp.]